MTSCVLYRHVEGISMISLFATATADDVEDLSGCPQIRTCHSITCRCCQNSNIISVYDWN